MRTHPTPDPLLQAVLDAVDVPAGARVLVAVSGGADSIALFQAVRAVVQSGRRDWEVGVAHVNHGLRGSQSDDDEQFVRTVAERAGLPFWSAQVNTRAHARSRRLSLEAAARELRYEALLDILARWKGHALLTGHTQDDQAETVLLRLLRGSGLRGLGGMRVRSERVVRPFLGTRREDLIRFLQSEGLGYRVDASNADLKHTRNRVRRELMPALDQLQPRLVPVLARTAESLHHDSDFILHQAHEALRQMDMRAGEGVVSASRSVWRSLHVSLRRATLVVLLDQLAGPVAEITHEHLTALEAAIERGTRPLEPLPHHIALLVTTDRFSLSTGALARSARLEDQPLAVPGVTPVGAGHMTARLREPAEDLNSLLAVCGPLHTLCDLDEIEGRLTVGARRSGERVTLLGAPGSRKVQDLLVDRKVPREKRDGVPMIRDETGIVWIVGVGLAARTAILPETRRILHLTWTP